MTNRNYKEKIEHLGGSDIAALTVVHPKQPEFLSFGEDGVYSAYILNDWKREEIPSHYELEIECKSWVKIFDDDSLVFRKYAERIEIYRAGDFGCIINLINEN